MRGLCNSTTPPLWPETFVLTQRRFPIDWKNRTADATTTTYYDAKRAANLIHIVNDKTPNTTMWDLELDNHHSYYFDPQTKECKTIQFPVGILRQNWLANATSLGYKNIRGRKAVGWTKVDFIDYWADEQTCEPLSWTFHTMRARFDSIYWGPGVAIPDVRWFEPPSFCGQVSSPALA